MATVNDLKKAVATTKTADIRDLIQQSTKEIGKSLPRHMSAERLVRIALTTLRLTPKLYECTPDSFLGALFQSAQLGLEPNIEGQAYILPFNNKRKVNGEWKTLKEAQFLVGYKGYVELFYRHEKALSLDMQIVRENDNFDYSLGTNSYIKHKPVLVNRGNVLGYYAVAKLKGGAELFKFMSEEECMEHGQEHSKCYDKRKREFYANTPWATEPDAMCMKTVLIQLMKLLPKSIEIQKAVAMDDTTKVEVDKDMFAVSDKTDWSNGNGETEKMLVDKDNKPEEAEVLNQGEMTPEDITHAGKVDIAYKFIEATKYNMADKTLPEKMRIEELTKFITELETLLDKDK